MLAIIEAVFLLYQYLNLWIKLFYYDIMQ